MKAPAVREQVVHLCLDLAERGFLAAGASPVVHVSFPVSELAVTPADIDGTGRPSVEAGNYQVQVGNQTANFSITG